MTSGVLPKKILAGLAIVAVVLSSLLLFPVYAQVVGATLTGTITDTSGAVIPQAQIAIKDLATGLTRDVTTDKDGFYAAPNLILGTYEITVTARGFATSVQRGVTLTVGAQQVLNVTMRVGQTTEQVQVTGQAAAVQLATSSISAEVNSTTVRELPLNGRSWTDLATLQAGVNVIENQVPFTAGGDRGNRGFGTQATISGQRPQENNYRLDGISMNDYANGAPGSVIGGNLGVDAIQEFSVLTTNYSAEYGKTSGGVINAVTRSGTNQLHGNAYEFLRNSALDARNFFDLGSIPPFKRNQFGGSAGGPIQKDRTFIFGDYEGIRQSKGVSQVATVPSPAARLGQLAAGTVRVDPAAQEYLTFWPLPNAGLLGNGDIGKFVFAGQQVVNENFLTSRLDHKFSDKDSLFGTYVLDRTVYRAPDGLDDISDGDLTMRQIYAIEETHIFSPGLVNSVRFGFNRVSVDNNLGVKAINPAGANPSLGAIPGLDATGVTVGGGITTFQGGVNGVSFNLNRWNSYQAYDDAFLTRDTHSLKFGGAFERMQYYDLNSSNQGGVFNFASLNNFLTNIPAKFTAAFPNTVTPRGFRQSLFGAYLQDDWRWRPNLTLNAGLRYEMVTVPTEAQGKLSILLNITDATPHIGNPFWINPTLRNFEPRMGFSWDPFRNGKTAVRGGFGVFDVLPLLYQISNSGTTSFPFFKQGTVSGGGLPPGTFFTGALSDLGLSSFRIGYVDHQPPRDYVMQWNLNVQRELLPSLSAMVAYVGVRGVHQPFRTDDADMVIPTLTPQGYLWPTPAGSGTKINPNWGRMGSTFYDSNSIYHALQVQLTKKMSHGLQFQGAYTWSKAIDDNSSTLVGNAFGNSINALDWFDLRLSRGLSDFDIGQIVVINGTWVLPSPASLSGPAGWIAKGWQLGSIFKANGGIPFTATFGSDGDPLGLKSASTWAFPNRLTGPGCGSLINPGNPNNYIRTQCFALASPITLRGNAGRNILTSPGLSNLDFSVFKNNYIRKISENFNVQFRGEIFNILNRANFAPPLSPTDTDIFTASGVPNVAAGLLTSTTTTAREIQFALKLIW